MGNARVAFAAENEGVVCLAAVETEYQSFEENTLLNTNLREPNATANYTVDNTIDANEVVRLRGNDSNRQTGPGKLMQVMVGDTLSMEVFAYHQGGYTDNGSVNNATILSALISSITGAAPSGTEASNISSAINNNATSIFVGSSGNSSQPRAYLNYILFDKDFKFVDAGYNQVGNTSGAHQQLMITKPVEQAGFIYIYLSNESNTSHDVYFDDLRITHTKSKVLQEDHYYPFGLSINALSSSAPLSKPNKYLYNGKELQEETGWYDYGARLFDPAIGRFIQVDPLAEVTQEAWTPYHYVKNNPIKYIDPDGMIWKDQKEADRLKQNVQNRKEQLAKQKGRLEARIAKREAKGKSTEKLEGRIATINSRTESLDNTIEAIDAIGAHERTFDLVSNSGETNYVKEGSDGVINIQGSSDALHVHEIEHVSRSINSENGLEFTSSGYLQPTTATGLSDEIAGYTAQFGYQPSSLPGSVRSSDDIDLEYIGNLKKKDGTPVYPVLHQIWQNRQKGIRNYKKHKRKQKKDGN